MTGESDLGQWTMRLCDYMVDQVGEWDLILCNSDILNEYFSHGYLDSTYLAGVTAREMQIVFRHRPGGRAVFMAAGQVKELGRPPLQPPPYWTEERCITGTLGQKLVRSWPGCKRSWTEPSRTRSPEIARTVSLWPIDSGLSSASAASNRPFGTVLPSAVKLWPRAARLRRVLSSPSQH